MYTDLSRELWRNPAEAGRVMQVRYNLDFGAVSRAIIVPILIAGQPGHSFAGLPGTPLQNAVRRNDTLSQFDVCDRARILSAVASQTCLTPQTNCLLCCASYVWLIRATGTCSIVLIPPTPRSTESKTVTDWQRGKAIANPSLILKGRRVSGDMN